MISQPFNQRTPAQSFETPVKMVAHIAKRLVQPCADLPKSHIFKIVQLQRLTLQFSQILEGTLQAAEVEPGSNFSFNIIVPRQGIF
jgi:hypothetical protein